MKINLDEIANAKLKDLESLKNELIRLGIKKYCSLENYLVELELRIEELEKRNHIDSKDK
jgi:hypothetical protein